MSAFDGTFVYSCAIEMEKVRDKGKSNWNMIVEWMTTEPLSFFIRHFFYALARVSVSILKVRARPLYACEKKGFEAEREKDSNPPLDNGEKKTPLKCEYVTVLLYLIIIILVHLNNEQLHFVCIFFVTVVEKLSLLFARCSNTHIHISWSTSLQPRPRKDRVEQKSHIHFMIYSLCVLICACSALELNKFCAETEKESTNVHNQIRRTIMSWVSNNMIVATATILLWWWWLLLCNFSRRKKENWTTS